MNYIVICSKLRLCADQPIIQALVIALRVKVRHVLRNRSTQRRLTNEDHLPQAFFLDRANEPLSVGIQVR